MLTAGILLLWGTFRDSARAYRYGCWIALVWCSAMCAIQLYAFIDDVIDPGVDTANPIGIAVWFYISFMYRLRFNLSGKWSA
jgi:hypothetical protein